MWERGLPENPEGLTDGNRVVDEVVVATASHRFTMYWVRQPPVVGCFVVELDDCAILAIVRLKALERDKPWYLVGRRDDVSTEFPVPLRYALSSPLTKHGHNHMAPRFVVMPESPVLLV